MVGDTRSEQAAGHEGLFDVTVGEDVKLMLTSGAARGARGWG